MACKYRGQRRRVKTSAMAMPLLLWPCGLNTVEIVEEFIYLGCNLSSDGNCTPEVLRRISLATAALRDLCRVWKQKRLRLATKRRIYETCVLAVLLCCAETWTQLKSDSDTYRLFTCFIYIGYLVSSGTTSHHCYGKKNGRASKILL